MSSCLSVNPMLTLEIKLNRIKHTLGTFIRETYRIYAVMALPFPSQYQQ